MGRSQFASNLTENSSQRLQVSVNSLRDPIPGSEDYLTTNERRDRKRTVDKEHYATRPANPTLKRPQLSPYLPLQIEAPLPPLPGISPSQVATRARLGTRDRQNSTDTEVKKEIHDQHITRVCRSHGGTGRKVRTYGWRMKSSKLGSTCISTLPQK